MSTTEPKGCTEIQVDNEAIDIYFIVSEPKEKEDNEKENDKKIKFISKLRPKIIDEKEIEIENDSCMKHKVFKLNIKDEKEVKIEYEIGDYIYCILFPVKGNYFLYDVNLLKRHKFFDNLPPEDIAQNIISYNNKLQIFLDALEKNKETIMNEQLYEETIHLYKKKKDFNLLIYLFLKVYENDHLCPKLLKYFNNIDVLENAKVDKNLVEYLETFHKIFSDDKFINSKKYELLDFYGIIICYLYYYDLKNKYFSNDIKELYQKNSEILYKILIKFHNYFIKPLNQDIQFYYDFIGYVMANKDIKTFEKVLKYIKDIVTFLDVIYKYRDDIISYFTKPTKIKPELKLIKKNYTNEDADDEEDKKEINELTRIIKLINKIIDYSRDNKTLLIYLTNQFWIYLLSQYKTIIDKDNIDNCYKLRKIFKKYYELTNFLYNGKNLENNLKDEYKTIQSNAKRYYDRDEFGYILNKNVKEYLAKNKETNSNRLAMIKKYNPYFNIEDEDDKKKFVNFKDTSIFDYINFDEVKNKEQFIKDFRALKFEEVFNNNIREYIIKMISKINNIRTFGIVIKLINLEKIKDKQKDYYALLEEKYDDIKNEIGLKKSEEELNKDIKIICEFINMIYFFEKEENKKKESKKGDEKENKIGNNCRFLKEKIDKLDNKIKSLIYNELIKINKSEEFNDMKQFIFNYFIKEIDDADSIIKVIDNLANYSDKKKFLKDFIEKCKFTKDEFFSNHEKKKIKLLSDLNEKLNTKKSDENEDGFQNKKLKLTKEDLGEEFETTLDQIRQDMDSNSFSKSKLEDFLKSKEINKKPEIVKKLGLLKIVIDEYDAEEIYDKLTERINKMNEDINKLNFIKKSISIFHKVKFKDQIDQIGKIIKDIEDKPIVEFDSQKTKDSITHFEQKYLGLAKRIDDVKNLLIFKIIFGKTRGDEEERFNKGETILNGIKDSFLNHQNKYENKGINKDQINEDLDKIMEDNKEIFNKMKNELSKYNVSKSDKYIDQMIDYFGIKNEQLIKDIKIFFKSKKFEIDIKSIKYFFENFLSTKLTIPEDIEKKGLSNMKLIDIKRILEKLKKENIYNYESDSYYYNIFTSLYQKDEALEFLLKKIKNNSNIDKLKGSLDPTQRRLNLKNIEDTIECLETLRKIMNKNEKEILQFIKELDKDKIDKFISYSKIYEAIKELDESNPEEDDDNIVKNVDDIIKEAYFEFREDKEDFNYYKDGKFEKIELNDLINKSSQINIRPINSNINNKNDEGMSKKKDLFEIKCEKLKFFKNLVVDLEEIYDKMLILRVKGCNIPRIIKINIKYPNIDYYLNGQIFENKDDIKKFLFNIKIDFENRLNQVYKDEKYSRFLYGKIFRKIQLHISGNCEISEIIRYILNITDNNEEIKDGDMDNTASVYDYYTFYSLYNSGSFDRITKYIASLFDKNKLDLESHYKKMLIKEEDKFKGFDFIICKKISMEEYILSLFKEKLGIEQLPISQNLLICSKETSIEEIQSFLYRAILCEYNTLFVFEIIESLTDFQYSKIYTYIDRILSIKLEKYKSKNKENVDKLKTKIYLNSYIVFIYNKKEVKNNLKELEKYKGKKLDNENVNKGGESGFISNNSLENINFKEIEKVESSDEYNEQDKDFTISDSILDILNKIKFEFENIKIISSDVCGLGKSYQIQKMIKLKSLKYYHLPLGGILTKNIIYKKISSLFEKIEEDNKITIKKIKKILLNIKILLFI